MRRILHWIGAAVVLLLVGALWDAVRATRLAAGRASLLSASTVTTPGTPLQSAVLLQESDCTGNLRVLDVVHHPALADRLSLTTLWFVGPVSDSTRIRALLPSWTRTVPLRAASRAITREFARLGHTTTPVLVLYDQQGRVRLTTQSPRTPREFAGLRRAIDGLTWMEEF